MPAIPDKFLDSVVYLYRSQEEAEAGEHAGGSGFLVEVPRGADVPGSLYIVTNSHVVRDMQGNQRAGVARLNRHDGTTDVLVLPFDGWHHHPDGDDVAVQPIVLAEQHRFAAISTNDFVPREDMGGVRPGDDVFLLGRFITHDGRQRNLPTVRFGHVAMLPLERIPTPRGIDQESFLVEVLSLSGYSGSPVVVHTMYASSLSMFDPSLGGGPVTVASPRLLGVDWGHLPRRLSVRDRTGDVYAEQLHVRQNSGMAGVVPAWKLLELLDTEELVEMRRDDEERFRKATENSELDVHEDAEESPYTREDFLKDLDRASRPDEKRQRGTE